MSDCTSTNVTQKKRLDYDGALERIMGLADFERSTHSPGHSSFHLERIGLLMERLGNVHLDMPTVHVAGTKGKGSTSAMVTSMLSAQGYITGLFTSPHLHSAVERVRVGMKPISKDDFAAVVEQIWTAVDWTSKSGGYDGVSTFEALTAMAFVHFKNISADFQVMEVGLGGRLDSTNIVMPEVSVITSISMDHMATLGDTIEKIAFEKAGIIKPNVPVVVAPQVDAAMQVFLRIAEERNAPLIRVDKKLSWQEHHADKNGQTFKLTGLRDMYDLNMPLLGDYQLENAATAVAAIETLIEKGFEISKESIVQGLKDVQWPARLQMLSGRNPGEKLLLVDGAHNPYSMRRLVEAIRRYFEFDRVILVFGSIGGHSAKGMLEELTQLTTEVIAVKSRHPRSASSDVVSDVAREEGMQVIFSSETVDQGLQYALDTADEGDLVLGTGSLSVAAEIIEEMQGIEPELYPYIKPPTNTGTPTVI